MKHIHNIRHLLTKIEGRVGILFQYNNAIFRAVRFPSPASAIFTCPHKKRLVEVQRVGYRFGGWLSNWRYRCMMNGDPTTAMMTTL